MDGLVGLAQGRLTSAGLAERHWRTRLAEARERVLRPSPRPRKAGAALWARLTPAAKWALGVATAVAGAVIADLIFGFLSR